MHMCKNCNSSCLEEHSDRCILYTGPSFEKLGVESGQYYDKVITNLLQEVIRICEETVELSCVFTGECDSCDTEVKVPRAVELLIQKICTLTASDIRYEGERYCIGDTSISSGAVQLMGRGFTYTVQPSSVGTSISYDLTGVINGLPSGYRAGRVSTVMSGQPKRGRTILLDSDKPTLGAVVENDRFPVSVDIDMRVATPSGDVKMVKRLSIPSPLAGSYTANFAVQDFGNILGDAFTLEDFVAATAAQSCANTTDLESLKTLDLAGCDQIQYASTDIIDIIAQQSAVLCGILDRLDALESMTVSLEVDDCGTKTFTGTPEEVAQEISNVCSGLRTDVNGLSTQVQTLRDVGCSNCSSNGAGGIAGNSGILGDGSGTTITTGGSCRGGRCT